MHLPWSDQLQSLHSGMSILTDTDCILVQAEMWCWCVWSGMASAAAVEYGNLSQNPPLRWAPPARRSGPSPGCRRPRPYRASDHMETSRRQRQQGNGSVFVSLVDKLHLSIFSFLYPHSSLSLFSLQVHGDLHGVKMLRYLTLNYPENVEWVSRILMGNKVLHIQVCKF